MMTSTLAVPPLAPAADASDRPAPQEYVVTNQVLLAGQPRPEDWTRWAAAGYVTVLNLRGDAACAAAQAPDAAAAGLRYLHRPWPAYLLEREHVDEFAEILADPATGRLVFHCRTASRVGLLWLLYRQLHHGWTRAAAEAELVAAGYDADAIATFDYCADDYFERAAAVVAG